MTPSRLAELRELEKGRTKGPWIKTYTDLGQLAGFDCRIGTTKENGWFASLTGIKNDAGTENIIAKDTAEFICALVNAAPLLLELWSVVRLDYESREDDWKQTYGIKIGEALSNLEALP